MRGKIAMLGSLFILFLSFTATADPKPPKDFTVTYEFVQGGNPKAATIERYAIQGNTLTLETDYIPTQYGSDVSKRTKEAKSYPLSDDEMKAVWKIITTHNFMDWPNQSPQRPPMGGNQTMTIKADGKTSTHTMWEPANRDQFTEFMREFLQWAKRKMTVQF